MNVQRHIQQFGPVERPVTPQERFENVLTAEERQAGLERYRDWPRETAEMLIRQQKIRAELGDDGKSWARESMYVPSELLYDLVTA